MIARDDRDHDIAMIACVITHNLFDEVLHIIKYRGEGGVMSTYDKISHLAIEFHQRYEEILRIQWGEEDLSEFGFKWAQEWEEAIIEFTEVKFNIKYKTT